MRSVVSPVIGLPGVRGGRGPRRSQGFAWPVHAATGWPVAPGRGASLQSSHSRLRQTAFRRAHEGVCADRRNRSGIGRCPWARRAGFSWGILPYPVSPWDRGVCARCGGVRKTARLKRIRRPRSVQQAAYRLRIFGPGDHVLPRYPCAAHGALVIAATARDLPPSGREDPDAPMPASPLRARTASRACRRARRARHHNAAHCRHRVASRDRWDAARAACASTPCCRRSGIPF